MRKQRESYTLSNARRSVDGFTMEAEMDVRKKHAIISLERGVSLSQLVTGRNHAISQVHGFHLKLPQRSPPVRIDKTPIIIRTTADAKKLHIHMGNNSVEGF